MFKSYKATVLIEDNTPLNYNPTLEPNYANVTVTNTASAHIYIDENFKGIGTWTGKLEAGSHVIEARKNGHRTTLREVVIIPEDGSQSYTLPDPEPIYGSLTVTSTPPLAKVLIDGEWVGETPITQDLIIGQHSVSVQKDGYDTQILSVNIEEGKEIDKNVNLVKRSITGTSTTTYSETSYSTGTSYTSKGYTAPKIKQRKQRKKIEGFNVGIYAGIGYNLYYLDEGYDYYFTEFNAGLLWRLWRYDSMFNVMTGVQYMRADELNFVSVPAVVNMNMNMNSVYFGVGTELTFVFDPYEKEYGNKSYLGTTFPVVLQIGSGSRHWDFNIYLKGYILEQYFLDPIWTFGMRLAYLF
jgi:hypothetical protein